MYRCIFIYVYYLMMVKLGETNYEDFTKNGIRNFSIIQRNISTSTGLAWVCTRSSAYRLWMLSWCFYKTLKSETRYVSKSFACSWDSFASIKLPYATLIWRFLSCLLVSCFVSFGCCLWEDCSFLKGAEWEGSVKVRVNGSWDVLYERWDYFQLKTKKKKLRS